MNGPKLKAVSAWVAHFATQVALDASSWRVSPLGDEVRVEGIADVGTAERLAAFLRSKSDARVQLCTPLHRGYELWVLFPPARQESPCG